MADLLQIGLSGIYSSQASLATTGHNIANVNTEGYSRQTVNVTTAGAHQQGNYFIGQGSMVEGIERAYDQFAFTENVMNTSKYAYTKEVYTQNSQMDQVLSGSDTAATGTVLTVFKSINDITSNPDLPASRSVFLESSASMVSQYNRLYDTLAMQYSAVNTSITDSAQGITTLAENLANLNEQISVATVGLDNANDLMDQRDQVLTELSELVNVSVVDSDNGMINVFIGSGQALVTGDESAKIISIIGDPDPSRKELAINSNDHVMKINGAGLGAKVSALFDTRNNDIERAFNQLGQSVIGLTHSINEQQKEGQTLDGNIGGDIFNDVNSDDAMENRVLMHNDGLGSAQLSLRIDDLSELSADDYDLVVDGYAPGPPEKIQFTVTNQTTGDTQTLGPVDLSLTRRVEIPDSGLSLGIDAISAGDSPQVGKSFTLRPTRFAAQDVSLQDIEPSEIAAADAQIKAVAVDSNTGDAKLRVSALKNPLDPLYMDEDNPLDIVITANTGGVIVYEIHDKNGNPVTLPVNSENSFSPAKVVGDSLTSLSVTPDPLSGKVTFSLAGVDVEMYSGDPAVGDKFTLNYNETGDGDSRNIKKMADLQTQKIMNNNKSTFQDVYSGMVSEIGSKTANADVSMQSAKILQTQSFERVQNSSGVNMDEEAADLLKYQQYYSAASRVISIASELFDTILQASR